MEFVVIWTAAKFSKVAKVPAALEKSGTLALEEGDDDGGEDDEDEEGGDERGSLRRTRNFELGMGNEEWDPRLRR